MTLNIHSSEDARRIAQRRLPWMVFDYIDGAAGRETGAARNRAAFDALTLRPRILRDVSRRDLASSVFGQKTNAPFGISPMGMCNLSGAGADLMLARLAARENVPLGVSTVASTAMEPLIEAAEGNAWFQLYFSGDGVGTFKLVERAKAAGYQNHRPHRRRCRSWPAPSRAAPRLYNAIPHWPQTIRRFCTAPPLVLDHAVQRPP